MTVKIEDQFGNLVSSDNTDKVTLGIASGPGGFAGGSTTTVTVSGGIATFGNLVLNTAGSYTAERERHRRADRHRSSAFTVTPAGADHLIFGVEPSDATAGVPISPA